MIKYIGSKKALLPWINDVVLSIHSIEKITNIVDLFSGSARVAHSFKKNGFFVIANDTASYSFVLAKALIEADKNIYSEKMIVPILEELQKLPPQNGWFTNLYSEKAKFFHPKNGALIEAIREKIENYSYDPLLKYILLTSLILAADKVDSTAGVQMAYLKNWAPRALNPLRLEYPPLLPGKGLSIKEDALKVSKEIKADLFYLDPPYNQHSYLANYHVWETLVLWDKPQTYGVAQKRVDVKERKSPFNSKKQAKIALENVVMNIEAKHIIVSFNNEGFLSEEDINEILRNWGYVTRLSKAHKRYIGAKIGIYNSRGEKVGTPGPTKNKEFLFVATKNKKVIEHIKFSFSQQNEE